MTKPSRYVLGGNIELIITTVDIDGNDFIPAEARLSIKEPSGIVVTISGGDMNIVVSGYMSYLYRPPTRGWFEYESWVKDGDREDTDTNGFDVYDRVY